MRFSLAAAAALALPILSASAENITVLVGANGLLAFSPSNITANVGDVIQFQFQAKNHSVTQSTFANPCEFQTTPAPGIDSGFQFVSNTSTTLPQWSFTVNNASAPLWFFCAQTNPVSHCNMGMVFSVNANPNSAKSFAVYQAAAMAGNNAAAVESSAAANAPAASASAPAAGGAAPTDSGAGAATAPSVGTGVTAAAGSQATDAANALSSGLTSPQATGGVSNNGNSTGAPPNAGFRVSARGGAVVVALGLGALLL